MRKEIQFIHSTLKAINVESENNDIILEAEENYDIANKWIAKFFSLD